MLTLDVSNTFQVSGLTRQFKKDIFSHHSQNILRHIALNKEYINLVLTVPKQIDSHV